ncbi:GDSL esterase/lipase 5 [Morus notabilis]|uniref:GDSL esterase/lipase 5 n=1 Tax=Morus notabilis TaxID=981085 RepID=W9RMY4_9ROSA|nr:GDSL esterase/lipase 5 [Morus notabilis]
MSISVRFPCIFCPSAVCVISLINTAIIGAAHYDRSPEKHVALFVFGDSLYDPGNNNFINTTTGYQANFWPYEETFFGFPTGRFSNGRLIPDFIRVHNYVNGVNFASAGAGALAESHQGFVVDLKTQLNYFKKVEKQLMHKLGAGEAKKLISLAVYLFSVGSNDYLSHFTSNSSLHKIYSKKEYVGMVLGNITQVIQIGGRKFGFVSLPPMGCFPGTKILQQGINKGSSCFEEVNSLAKLHNRALHKSLQATQNQLKGFIYSMHDLYTSFSERLENPSKYGFREAKMACCGTGKYRGISSCGGKIDVKDFVLCDNLSDYFFFDSAHPTEKAYKQLAKLIWSGTLGFNSKTWIKDANSSTLGPQMKLIWVLPENMAQDNNFRPNRVKPRIHRSTGDRAVQHHRSTGGVQFGRPHRSTGSLMQSDRHVKNNRRRKPAESAQKPAISIPNQNISKAYH